MEERCLTIQQAAKYLSVSTKTLSRHKDIVPIKIGRLTRYDKEALDAYISQKNQEALLEALG